MTTFLEFKNLIYTNIGRDSTDSAMALVVPVAINYALKTAAALFKPPEMFTETDQVVTNGTNSHTFTSSFIDLISIYNVTGSNELGFIAYENFRVLVPTTTDVKYYTVFGRYIILNTTVSADTTLRIGYIAYPDDLENDDDEPSFDEHDSYIVSVATAICWAVLEEGDSVQVWESVASALGLPMLKASQAKEVFSGKMAFLESAVTGTLTGSQGGQ